jgi:hypothetical protein
MTKFKWRLLFGGVAAMLILACSWLAGEVSPTPRFVSLPRPAALAEIVGGEVSREFRYLPWYWVPEDTEAWLFYGWPGEEKLFKAVFRVVGGEWTLIETEEIIDEEPQQAAPGQEVWR